MEDIPMLARIHAARDARGHLDQLTAADYPYRTEENKHDWERYRRHFEELANLDFDPMDDDEFDAEGLAMLREKLSKS